MTLDALQRELRERANRYQLSVYCDSLGEDVRWWAVIERIPVGERFVPTSAHVSKAYTSLAACLEDLDRRLSR